MTSLKPKTLKQEMEILDRDIEDATDKMKLPNENESRLLDLIQRLSEVLKKVVNKIEKK